MEGHWPAQLFTFGKFNEFFDAVLRVTHMPWWAILYLVCFAALSVAGVWGDCRERRPAWFLACAILSNLALVYFFVAYWRPVLRVSFWHAAPVIYLASVLWEVFSMVDDVRSLRGEPSMVEWERRIVPVVTAVATAVICLPAFIVAGISAFAS